MSEPSVLLFVDNSNVFLSARDEAIKKEGPLVRNRVRLQFEKIIELALCGRKLGQAYVVGSVPPEERAVWDRLAKATGVEPELYERGSVSGGEQGLDQCLQVHMLRAISDFQEPQIAVLMTGDGAGYDDGVGFHADMERMHAAGWAIEVLSWQTHCKRTLRQWAEQNGVFVALDEFYDAITFVEQARKSGTLDLSRRKLATPGKSPAKIAEERVRAEMLAELIETKRKLAEAEAEARKKKARKDKYEKRYARGKK